MSQELGDTLKNNLDTIKKYMEQHDSDWVHVTVGGEGKGKSTLNASMSFYLDDSFNSDRMHFNGEQFRSTAMNLTPLQAISHDEAVEDMYKREGMTTEVRNMIKFLRKCRYLQLFITLSLPSLTELDRSLWDPRKTDEPRVKSIARVVKPGWTHFYSQYKFSKIDTDSENGVEWPTPDFRAPFPNLKKTRPDFWTAYMEKKDRDISAAEQLDDDVDLPAIAEAVKQQRDRYISIYNQREYVDADLIEMDFNDLSGNQAKKVKKKVEADLGIN